MIGLLQDKVDALCDSLPLSAEFADYEDGIHNAKMRVHVHSLIRWFELPQSSIAALRIKQE